MEDSSNFSWIKQVSLNSRRELKSHSGAPAMNRPENAYLEGFLAATCVSQTSRMIPDNFISVVMKGG